MGLTALLANLATVKQIEAAISNLVELVDQREIDSLTLFGNSY